LPMRCSKGSCNNGHTLSALAQCHVTQESVPSSVPLFRTPCGLRPQVIPQIPKSLSLLTPSYNKECGHQDRPYPGEWKPAREGFDTRSCQVEFRSFYVVISKVPSTGESFELVHSRWSLAESLPHGTRWLLVVHLDYERHPSLHGVDSIDALASFQTEFTRHCVRSFSPADGGTIMPRKPKQVAPLPHGGPGMKQICPSTGHH
jgi:hypothetical protein